MLNISTQDQQLLYKQSQLKKLETNQYLVDVDNENYKYIKSKFFQYELDEKCKLLNIGSWLFSTISDVFAFYTGNPSYDFGVQMVDFVRDMVSLWFCTIWLERVDGKLNMIYQPAKNYWYENGIHKISRLYIDDKNNIYVLIQEYPVGQIINKLYLTSNGSLSSWTEVWLDTIPQTAGLLPVMETGLSVPALLVVEDSAISLVEKIKPLVYAVDRQVVMNHTQYLQNLESFILFKNIKRPQKLLDEYEKGKRIDFSAVGRILNWWDDSSIEFINNVNSLISESMKDSDNNIRRISSTTTLPIEFLWLDSNEWAVGEGSRTLRHWAFMKRVEYIRDQLDEALMLFLELSWEKEANYTRPDVFAKSDKDLVDEIAIARENKLISLVNAIKKYNNYTDEEAQNEYDTIIAEESNKTLDPNNDDNGEQV